MNRALRAATLGVLLLSPVALSACSAGQVTQTATQVRDKTGGEGQVGDITLREVQLAAAPDNGSYAPGGNAELQVAISNDGNQSDTLTGITGSGFRRAVFTDVASLEGISSGSASSSAAPTASSSAAAPTAGATGTATGVPATGAPTAPATASRSAAPTEIPIPARHTVFVGLDQQDSHITLLGLDTSLTTGQYVTLTFTFAKAGAVTVLATPATPSAPSSRTRATFDFNQTQGSNG